MVVSVVTMALVATTAVSGKETKTSERAKTQVVSDSAMRVSEQATTLLNRYKTGAWTVPALPLSEDGVCEREKLG